MTDPSIPSGSASSNEPSVNESRVHGPDKPFRPLIFGEALFDHFPDGTRVLGGAPFNVAWHLRGFKGDPLMVTAVGEDDAGAEILSRMEGWGMTTAGVQIHSSRSTGRVTAHLDGDEPRYEIEARQAYDFVSIEGLPAELAPGSVDLLYHGTLGLREETSRQTLRFLREKLDAPILVDVNLRDPWWVPAAVREAIQGSPWVKMNREETNLLARAFEVESSGLTGRAEALRNRVNLGRLVVTLGADGVLLVTDEGVWREEAPEIRDTLDTVGAGDAFSAVLILGIHNGWPLDRTLRRATEFAGELCRIRGAIPPTRGLYDQALERWSDAS